MKAYCIEGNELKLDGGAMFGHVPKALWNNWTACDEQNRIPLASRCLFLESDKGQKILVETGVGSFFDTKMKERYGVFPTHSHKLLEELEKRGVKEQEIDIVILTHLHFDHAGGLLPGYEEEELPRLLFPNATYIVSKKHWEYVKHPSIKEQKSFIPLIQQLLEKSGRLALQETTQNKLLEIPHTFYFTDGHTIGMMLFETLYQNAPLFYASDLIPGAPWMHLPVTMGYDRFAEKIVEEKEELLSSLLKRNGRIVFCHDNKIAAANIALDEKGRYKALECSLEEG